MIGTPTKTSTTCAASAPGKLKSWVCLVYLTYLGPGLYPHPGTPHCTWVPGYTWGPGLPGMGWIPYLGAGAIPAILKVKMNMKITLRTKTETGPKLMILKGRWPSGPSPRRGQAR